MLETITKNPMPAALVGLGIYWLLKNPPEEHTGSRPPIQCGHKDYGDSSGDASIKDRVKESMQSAKDSIQDQVTDWKDQAGSQAQHWKEQASRKVQLWKEGTGQKMEEVKGYIQEQSSAARNVFHSRVETNPLAMAAVMVAMGAAVAAALPGSRKEDQWMGGSRDKMMNVVKTKVRSTVDEVALKTGQAAQKAFTQEE